MKGFLRLRGNSYYFRCRVPLDLYGTFFKGKEILKALHTRDKRIAQDAAAEWYCRSSRLFHLCRIHSLPEQQLIDLIQAELFTSSVAKKKVTTSPNLRDLFDSYIKEHIVNWREKSEDEVTYSLTLAVEAIGNIPVTDLTIEVIKSYLATIIQLPANHRKKPSLRNLSIHEIIKIGDLEPMSRKSVCKHVQWLGAALKHSGKLQRIETWLINSGSYPVSRFLFTQTRKTSSLLIASQAYLMTLHHV